MTLPVRPWYPSSAMLDIVHSSASWNGTVPFVSPRATFSTVTRESNPLSDTLRQRAACTLGTGSIATTRRAELTAHPMTVYIPVLAPMSTKQRDCRMLSRITGAVSFSHSLRPDQNMTWPTESNSVGDQRHVHPFP